MKTIIQTDGSLSKKQIEDLKTNFPGSVIIPQGAHVSALPSYGRRAEAIKLAIDLFAARGSNPQTSLIETAQTIYEFLIQDEESPVNE